MISDNLFWYFRIACFLLRSQSGAAVPSLTVTQSTAKIRQNFKIRNGIKNFRSTRVSLFVYCKFLISYFVFMREFIEIISMATIRSSRLELFWEKGVLKNFVKFTWKHLCQNIYFNKVAELRPEACNFI